MTVFETLALPQSELRQAITRMTRAPEPDCVRPLLALLPEPLLPRADIATVASGLVRRLRQAKASGSGVDALMREFSLSSQEGVALMCLAEALLRIPDRANADRLIRDKIGKGDWRAHIGHSRSLFVNAAAWGLLVTGALTTTASARGLGAALTRLIAKGGEPLIRAGVDLAMRLLGRQFVLGETINDALHHARPAERRGYRFSYDMLGEAALTEADALRYLHAYETAIMAIGVTADGETITDRPGISVKLSALHPRYSRAQRGRVMAELVPRLAGLMRMARAREIGISLDAEEADRLELSLDVIQAASADPALHGWNGIGFVVQAYQKRAPAVIDWIIACARQQNRRFMLRLVKGAYWDSEIKRAQEAGLADYPVYTRKAHTDIAYLACAQKMLAAPAELYPQFATHNAHTVAALKFMGQGLQWEYQCLHGMGEALYDQIVEDPQWARHCRIYAPVGTHATLLAYLVRRLLENGANSSFVHRVVDSAIPIETLIADPRDKAAACGGAPNPAIPLPGDLYLPSRRNACGIDLTSEIDLAGLAAAMPASLPPPPLDATPAAIDDAVRAAAASGWYRCDPAQRAAFLLRAADLFEQDMPVLMSLAVLEAGKTLPNAVGEVREAVDFLRYYASECGKLAGVTPLGVVACISPWNFPLAIFTGQVAAALAAGNAVLAKPAPQTTRMAAHAVALLHQAGVPRDALHLLPGDGALVGAAVVAAAEVAGVVFTGSTASARRINRALAAKGGTARLIAETGGQNAMIVDSSALPEQVVADVVASSFDSAGQRCSALRVLYVQQEIADHVIALLQGAMDGIVVGDPARLETDCGPVIDQPAQAKLLAHIENWRGRAGWIYQAKPPAANIPGHFVLPTAMEIEHIGQLTDENFGPILHVIRYRLTDLPSVLAAINATGFGLTFGIHSRIDETVNACVTASRAGNIYVNRNIIGAVVGVQPFGGHGLSGTGPKAGGPLYLPSLCHLSARANSWPVPLLPGKMQRLADMVDGMASLDTAAKSRVMRALYHDAAHRLAGTRMALPGPTGEENHIEFHPVGNVGCLADTVEAMLLQLSAALANGNTALLPANEPGKRLARSFADPAVGFATDLIAANIDVLLADTSAASMHEAALGLANREQALVQIVPREGGVPYRPDRLVRETVISINTAAAGGNASLMLLEE